MTNLFQSDLQPVDRAVVQQVLIDDFVDIFLVDIAIPGLFGVDHQYRPLGTTVEAAGSVDAHLASTMNAQFLAALFGIVA